MAAFSLRKFMPDDVREGGWSFEAKMFSILLTIVLGGGGWAFTQLWSQGNDTHDKVIEMRGQVSEIPDIQTRLSALERRGQAIDDTETEMRRDIDQIQQDRSTQKLNSLEQRYRHEKKKAVAATVLDHRDRAHFDRTMQAVSNSLKHDGVADP